MVKSKYVVIFGILILLLGTFTLMYPLLLGESRLGKKFIEEVIKVNHAKEIEEVLTKFDSIYTDYNRQSGAVGGAVVISYKGQIALMKCFGVKKTGETDSVDTHTIFRLASVSKTVTGVLAGILAEEKIIGLDAKVVDFIPGFRLKTPENTQQLTVRHLLSHTSGLPPHAFDMMVEDHVPLEQIIARLYESEIASPPGMVYGYQNVMYSLYAPMVEAITKKSYRQIIAEKVFVPFGMKDASIDFESFQENQNKAYPHQRNQTSYTSIKLNNRYYETAPAAGVNASISDLGQFLIAILQTDDDLFSNNAREITFTPQIETIMQRSYYRNWEHIDSKHYALGWRIIQYKNHTIAHHSGYVLGYQAEIAICRDSEVGIAVITNSPNSFFSANVPAFFNLFFEHKNKEAVEKNPPLKNSES